MGQDEVSPQKLLRRRSTQRLYPGDLADENWLVQFFTEPLWEELLPPPLPAPHQKPYTLLVSIDDLLVTSTWDVRVVHYLSILTLMKCLTAATRLEDSQTTRCRLFLSISFSILRSCHFHHTISLCKFSTS